MCGRFASTLPPEMMAKLFRTTGALPNQGPSWNMAPTQGAMVVRRHPETGERRLDVLQWGLIPHFTKDLKTARKPINARSEIAGTSGMFRGALASRRRSCRARRSTSGRRWRTASSRMPSRGVTGRSWHSPAFGRDSVRRRASRSARSRS